MDNKVTEKLMNATYFSNFLKTFKPKWVTESTATEMHYGTNLINIPKHNLEKNIMCF